MRWRGRAITSTFALVAAAATTSGVSDDGPWRDRRAGAQAALSVFPFKQQTKRAYVSLHKRWHVAAQT